MTCRGKTTFMKAIKKYLTLGQSRKPLLFLKLYNNMKHTEPNQTQCNKKKCKHTRCENYLQIIRVFSETVNGKCVWLFVVSVSLAFSVNF